MYSSPIQTILSAQAVQSMLTSTEAQTVSSRLGRVSPQAQRPNRQAQIRHRQRHILPIPITTAERSICSAYRRTMKALIRMLSSTTVQTTSRRHNRLSAARTTFLIQTPTTIRPTARLMLLHRRQRPRTEPQKPAVPCILHQAQTAISTSSTTVRRISK